jgi:hypothetical protein
VRYLNFGLKKKETSPSNFQYVNTGIEYKQLYCLGFNSEGYLVFLEQTILGVEQPYCLKDISFTIPTTEPGPKNKNSKTVKLRDGYGLCPIPKTLEEPVKYNLQLVPENNLGVISCQVSKFSGGLTLLAKNRHSEQVRPGPGGRSSSNRVEHPTTKRKFEGEASINSVNQMVSSQGQQLEEHGEAPRQRFGIGTDTGIAGQTQSMDPEFEWRNDYHPTLDWL